MSIWDDFKKCAEEAVGKEPGFGQYVHVRGDSALELLAERDALLAERDALAIRIYNSGYMAGHHDTVEGQFTDIHRSDMATYHAEEVSELIAALQGEQP